MSSPPSRSPQGLTLRPVMRKKRPSFSPQKWNGMTPEQQKQRSQSHGASTSNPPLPQKELQDPTMRNPKTAALDFEEFSYVDDQGKIRRIHTDWLVKLFEYLAKYYQAESVTERLPYLVVWCKDVVPSPSERPFMIAGLVAVWLVHKKDHYPADMDLGDAGRDMDNQWVPLEDNLYADLEPFVIPKTETLSAIMNLHFPQALAISFINHRIVVELEEVSPEEHWKRLGSLPCEISETVALRYHNGLIHGQELKRSKEPNPTKFNSQYDDTDYVKTGGCFYPGAMLSSKNNTLISAGILLQKQEERRLTVAIHCWDKQLESNVELGYEDYTIKQGDWADGTVVGTVTEQIGSSNIGLAKVDKPFSNRFLDLDGSASSLFHSRDMKSVNEVFWIDSFVTGPQRLASNGTRVLKANMRAKELFGNPSALLGPGKYVELVQGIYSTSAPEINGEPKIREGVCGAAVIRGRLRRPAPRNETLVGQGSSPTPSGRGLEKPSPADSATPLRRRFTDEGTGEVAGFMHWSDIQSVYNSGELLCFADVVDGLIEDGWSVVPVTEKRKADEASMVDDDLDPFVSSRRPPKK